VVDTKLLQACIQRGGNVGNVGQDFGYDVKLLAGDAGLLDSGSQLSLRFVHFGAVEVVVAQADGGFGAVDACLVKLGFVAGFVPGGTGTVA
jgi:hypothetical protein